MSETSEQPKPEFDFSNYSYGDTQTEFELRMKRQHIGQQLDTASKRTMEEYMALINEWRAFDKQIDAELCKTLVNVPRAWLVPSAPDKLDWSNPESLAHVRADRITALRKAAADARSPESASGN